MTLINTYYWVGLKVGKISIDIFKIFDIFIINKTKQMTH